MSNKALLIVVSTNNVECEDGTIYLPFYMSMFIK